MKRALVTTLLFALTFLWAAADARACKFTPLAWQQTVESYFAAPAMVGQRKHTTWVRDLDRTFIDDEIEGRFGPGEAVDVIVDLNECLEPRRIVRLLSDYGRLTYLGKMVTFAMLEGVKFDDLPKLASLPQVAMVEWQPPLVYFNDVSSRAAQSRTSVTFSPNTAQDAGFTGAGVNVAVIDSGVDNNHETFAGKFVAGFDASLFEDTNGNGIDDSCEPAPLGNGICTDADDEPANGTTDPVDAIGHGTHVAGIAVGGGAAGRTCSTPDDGSPTNCAGMASGAGLVDVKIDNTGSAANAAEAIDWVSSNAGTFNIVSANMSFGYCVDDDGTSALSQQVNFMASLGVVPVVAHGNASNCGLAPGSQIVMSPGSASLAMTVGGTNDRDTVARGDDINYAQFLRGPRLDFNVATPNLPALKPDITAPGENIFSAQQGTVSSYVSQSGTSMASPQVAGGAAVIAQARPGITPESVKDLLKRNADTTLNVAQFPAVDPVWDNDLGAGMLNLWAAVNAAAATDPGFPTCVGPPTSAGQPCELTPPLPRWNNTSDIGTAAAPQVGVANTITAQVRNNGAVPATFEVSFGVYVFGAGATQFFHVGSQQVTVPAMTTMAVNQPWTPAAANHQCVQVSIAYGLDTDFDNNVTQRNLQVAPSVWEVRVENPFMVPAVMEVEAKSGRDGWRCAVEDAEFVIDPILDCPRTIKVTYDAPRGAKPGEAADCEVAIFATPRRPDGKRELIGGVTVRTFVPEPCRLIGEVVDTKGRPIPGAVVVFEEEEVQTDEIGAFFAKNVTPYREQKITVAGRFGEHTVVTRPVCGVGAMVFEVGEKGVRVIHRKPDRVNPGPFDEGDQGRTPKQGR